MNTENKLVIERILNAPRERVWEACTKPEELHKWWGQPKDATTPVFEVDVRVGGSLHFKVLLPDGNVVWGKAIYKDIVANEKLVLEDHYSDEQGRLLDTPELPSSTITIILESEGNKTRLTIVHEGLGGGEHTLAQYKEGWSQVFNRLKATLS